MREIAKKIFTMNVLPNICYVFFSCFKKSFSFFFSQELVENNDCDGLLLMGKLVTNIPDDSDGYQCNNFLVEEENDPVTVYFYSLIKKFIRLFSKPFPHQGTF